MLQSLVWKKKTVSFLEDIGHCSQEEWHSPTDFAVCPENKRGETDHSLSQ